MNTNGNDLYLSYLNQKKAAARPAGFEVNISDLHPMLFDWQKLAVQWALHIGRAALFEERGLGKTLQQIEWAKQVHKKTLQPVLIVCPLAVARQTIREGEKIGVPIQYVRSMDDVRSSSTPIIIINYDMLEKMDSRYFGGLVLDESSILKSYQGKTKKFILNEFSPVIPYRLFCTATPAPNDTMELGNHAQGLDVMDSSQMLANWFQSGQGNMKTGEIIAGKYVLKPYAETDFWRWVTTWACIVSTPSDLGYDDFGYVRLPLDIRRHMIKVDHRRSHTQIDKKGQHYLFLGNELSATSMWREKKETYKDRVKKAIELVEDEPDEPHIIWCDTNDEAAMLRKELTSLYGSDVVEVRGSDKISDKEDKLDAFSTGNARIIITKSKIAGMGLNWQHCARQTFVSVNYKWEEWYQAVGRTDRYGNERQTVVNMIYTDTEQRIIKSLERKGKTHKEMHNRVRQIIKEFGLWRTDKRHINYDLGNERMVLPQWIA